MLQIGKLIHFSRDLARGVSQKARRAGGGKTAMTNRQAAAPTSEDLMLSLALAHARMTEALAILDAHSVLRAAATLDLAIHQLDRAIAGGL